MREAEVRAAGALRIVADLHGGWLAAVVYGANTSGHSLLRLNRAMLTGDSFDRVLSWARRELARGARVAWLLADELDALP